MARTANNRFVNIGETCLTSRDVQTVVVPSPRGRAAAGTVRSIDVL